jgi:hypothetical protein
MQPGREATFLSYPVFFGPDHCDRDRFFADTAEGSHCLAQR